MLYMFQKAAIKHAFSKGNLNQHDYLAKVFLDFFFHLVNYSLIWDYLYIYCLYHESLWAEAFFGTAENLWNVANNI